MRVLDNLEERGFDVSQGVLFVVDGGKAISKAIKDKWGDTVLVQRCRAHKYRNVTDLLPKSDHAWVKSQMNRAWKMSDPDEAELALRSLAAKIERTHLDAAASLREGLKETVTINAPGVTGALALTPATTNPMESTIDIVKAHARNVKRWRGVTCASDGLQLGCSRHRPSTDESVDIVSWINSLKRSLQLSNARKNLQRLANVATVEYHSQYMDHPKLHGKRDILARVTVSSRRGESHLPATRLTP